MDGNNFILLATDREPYTNNNTHLPASGSGAVWKYKAIYRLHDAPVGHWSDVISIAVGV
jgi:hypothetical protein